MKSFAIEQFEIDGNPVYIDDAKCVVLTRKPERSAIRYFLYLDIAHECMVKRFMRVDGQTVGYQIDLSYRQVAGQVPILSGWKISRFDHDGTLRLTVKATVIEHEMNPDIPDSEFSLEFPVGTFVDDLRSDPVNYIVRENGQRRDVLPSERGATYEQLLATDSGGAAPKFPHRRLTAVIAVSMGALIAARLVLRYRRHSN